MGFLSEYQPKKQEDSSGGFAPVKGAYVCRIDSIKHMEGIGAASGNPYDFYSLKVQVMDKVEGDNATNRYLDTCYNADEKGMGKLCDALFTAGLEVNKNDQALFDESLAELADKEINIRAWVRPKMKKVDGEWVPKVPEELSQKIKVVDKFAPSKIKEDATTQEVVEPAALPF